MVKVEREDSPKIWIVLPARTDIPRMSLLDIFIFPLVNYNSARRHEFNNKYYEIDYIRPDILPKVG